jgi:L-alanine-DL-glutamate epimerase-like enolase superfamily enzyme
VALAREIIGPGTELYVDANGGYTVGQAPPASLTAR